MIEGLKARLVREGRGWWKLWSNQFAIIAATAGAWAADNQQLVIGYFHTIPQPWRSLLTFAVMAIIPIWLRMARQKKLQPSDPPCPAP